MCTLLLSCSVSAGCDIGGTKVDLSGCKIGVTVQLFMNDHVTTLESSLLLNGFLSLEVFLGDVMAGLTSLRLRQSQAS